MAVIGNALVSTDEQNTDLQLDALKVSVCRHGNLMDVLPIVVRITLRERGDVCQ